MRAAKRGRASDQRPSSRRQDSVTRLVEQAGMEFDDCCYLFVPEVPEEPELPDEPYPALPDEPEEPDDPPDLELSLMPELPLEPEV